MGRVRASITDQATVRRQTWGGQGAPSAAARRRRCRPGLDGERHHRPGGPGEALLAGFGGLVRQAPARSVFVPLWSAYPAVGFGDRDALPTLRSEAADRIAGWGRTVTWPIACLHLIAESARLGLRELDRLEAAAVEKGRNSPPGRTNGRGCRTRWTLCCARRC